MNLGQLRQTTLDLLGVTSADAQFAAPTVDGLINLALHNIESERTWPWLETSTTFATVAGTESYAVPTDWIETRELRIANFTPLDLMGVNDLDNLLDAQGQPRFYAVSEDLIWMRPIPGGIYTFKHRYVRREPDLNQDADSPLMPTTFHPVIVAAAVVYCLRRSREEDRRLPAAEADYEKQLQKMKMHARRTAGSIRVRPRPGAWV